MSAPFHNSYTGISNWNFRWNFAWIFTLFPILLLAKLREKENWNSPIRNWTKGPKIQAIPSNSELEIFSREQRITLRHRFANR